MLWYAIFRSCHLKIHVTDSSAIIEDITERHESGPVTVAYFYWDFRDEDKQNCRNLLLSILSQLCSQSNLCCDIISHIYNAHGDGTRRPSDDVLTRCLNKMLSSSAQRPIYLIFDALDECPNNSGMPTPREEVLEGPCRSAPPKPTHLCGKSSRDRHTNHSRAVDISPSVPP